MNTTSVITIDLLCVQRRRTPAEPEDPLSLPALRAAGPGPRARQPRHSELRHLISHLNVRYSTLAQCNVLRHLASAGCILRLL